VMQAVRARIPGPVPDNRAGRGVMNPGHDDRSCLLPIAAPKPGPRPGRGSPTSPYLLLSITALCWPAPPTPSSGRLPAGHIPPVTLSFCAGRSAFFSLFSVRLETSSSATVRQIRARLGRMIVSPSLNRRRFNTLQYWALEHTQPLNTLLLQVGPDRCSSQCGR